MADDPNAMKKPHSLTGWWIDRNADSARDREQAAEVFTAVFRAVKTGMNARTIRAFHLDDPTPGTVAYGIYDALTPIYGPEVPPRGAPLVAYGLKMGLPLEGEPSVGSLGSLMIQLALNLPVEPECRDEAHLSAPDFCEPGGLIFLPLVLSRGSDPEKRSLGKASGRLELAHSFDGKHGTADDADLGELTTKLQDDRWMGLKLTHPQISKALRADAIDALRELPSEPVVAIRMLRHQQFMGRLEAVAKSIDNAEGNGKALHDFTTRLCDAIRQRVSDHRLLIANDGPSRHSGTGSGQYPAAGATPAESPAPADGPAGTGVRHTSGPPAPGAPPPRPSPVTFGPPLLKLRFAALPVNPRVEPVAPQQVPSKKRPPRRTGRR